MSTSPSHDITKDLLAIQAHTQTRPSLVPNNVVALVSWHVISEHFHVSLMVGPWWH